MCFRSCMSHTEKASGPLIYKTERKVGSFLENLILHQKTARERKTNFREVTIDGTSVEA
jgi:hypothetical protein